MAQDSKLSAWDKLSMYGFGGLIVLIIIIMTLIQLVAYIFGIWFKGAAQIHLGPGFLMMAVGIAVFGAMGLLKILFDNSRLQGAPVDKVGFLVWFMLTAVAIFMLLFLRQLVPEIFAESARGTAALLGIA